MHIRQVGDFTRALGQVHSHQVQMLNAHAKHAAEALGCDVKAKPTKPSDMKDDTGGQDAAFVVNPPINVVLPRIMVDGP